MKRAFLGCNSASGFVSYFGSVCNNNGKLYVLKGGSGSGKSTLLKKVIAFCETFGFDVEAYHCSSDIDSLDGVFIKNLNVAIIDGTSPHVVDPFAYGVTGEIINMGDAIKIPDASVIRGDALSILGKKRELYDTAYAYIASAGELFSDTAARFNKCMSESGIYDLANDIAEKLKLSDRNESGSQRRLFISAITPSGYVDFSDNFGLNEVHTLTGAFDSVYSHVLNILAFMAVRAGENVDIYMHPLEPSLVYGLRLKGREIGVFADSFMRRKKLESANKINVKPALTCFPKPEYVAKNIDYILKLMSCAYDNMKSAQDLHFDLENLYRPFIDFDVTNGKISEVLSKLQV